MCIRDRIIPGGGYVKLAHEISGIALAKWYNTLGVTAFVLMHRFPDVYKRQLVKYCLLRIMNNDDLNMRASLVLPGRRNFLWSTQHD